MKRVMVLLLSLLAISSCKEKEFKHYKIDQGLKGYFNWQKGTYWIFKDSLTGNMDSFAVTTYSNNDNNNPSDNYSTESFQLGIREYYNPDSNFAHWTFEIYSGQGSNTSSLVSTTFNVEYSPFTEGFPFSLTSSYSKVKLTLLPNVVINSITYANVFKYRLEYDNAHADEVFIDAEHGFIKISLGKNNLHKIIELEHSHIVH